RIEVVDQGSQVRDEPPRVSGPMNLAAGQDLVLTIRVSEGGIVRGRVTVSGRLAATRTSTKLLTRRVFEGPGGRRVEDIEHAQYGVFPDGRFEYRNVHPGPMEFLAWWCDEPQVYRFARTTFDLEDGAVHDLGEVEAIAGFELAIRVDLEDEEGRPIDPRRVRASDALVRVLTVEPFAADPAWPYERLVVDIGREFRVAGLAPGRWKVVSEAPETLAAGADATPRGLLPEWECTSAEATVDLPQTTFLRVVERYRQRVVRQFTVLGLGQESGSLEAILRPHGGVSDPAPIHALAAMHEGVGVVECMAPAGAMDVDVWLKDPRRPGVAASARGALPADPDATVAMRLVACALIEGQVVDAEARPLAHRPLRLVPKPDEEDPRGVRFDCDSQGRFRVLLPPNDWQAPDNETHIRVEGTVAQSGLELRARASRIHAPAPVRSATQQENSTDSNGPGDPQ
ncbi:MAG: hypothetical protein KDB18_13255, partial [Salinibacterium sp.]|nr:hypothetical protein [Salinibacterium sp.]